MDPNVHSIVCGAFSSCDVVLEESRNEVSFFKLNYEKNFHCSKSINKIN